MFLDEGEALCRTSTNGSGRGMRMTSQVLVASTVCETKGEFLMRGEPKLPPSAFTNDFTADGNEYEARTMEPTRRRELIALLNRGLKLALPLDTAVVDCEQAYCDQEYKAFINRQVLRTILQLERVQLGVPCIFTHPMLGRSSEIGPDIYDCGKSDLFIWTGSEWIVGDIKHSEAVSAHHGAQVYYYHQLSRQWFMTSPASLPGTLAARGFILRCAAGHRYARRAGEAANLEALNSSVVEVFSLSTLEPSFQAAYGVLQQLAACHRVHEPKFQRNCVECLFRRACYHTILLDRTDTHLSLLPMPDHEYAYLKEQGISSVEQLIAAGPGSPILLAVKDNRDDLVAMLLRKAEIVSATKGFSSWRSKAGWESSYALFASDGTMGRWFYNGAQTEVPPCPSANADVTEMPLVVVAFSESELRRAKFLLRSAGTTRKELRDLDYVCLSDEIREKVHLPLMSYTLRATADYFRQLTGGASVKQILQEWFARFDRGGSVASEGLEETGGAGDRLVELGTVWDSLLELEERSNRVT